MSIFRNVKTTQERRARRGLEADRDDLAVDGFHVSSRRSTLPHAWDDISRGKSLQSWKCRRQTKWRT